MSRVALVVTGDLERLGLAESLQRVFPSDEFHVEAKLDGFTSGLLPHRGSTPVRGLVDKLAAALVAAVDPGRTGTPSDFAVAVDDLEIVNLHQPDLVVDTFRDAVARYAATCWSNQARTTRAQERLRTRASFHLLSPMTEAYFFGDPAALAAAGARGSPQLAPGVDLEAFTVVDATFLAAPAGSAKWARADRARHPKEYLRYLVDPTHPPEVEYRETKQGRAALAKLDWAGLSRSYGMHLQLMRSLLVDVADAVGAPTPVPAVPLHPATSRKAGVLRNA